MKQPSKDKLRVKVELKHTELIFQLDGTTLTYHLFYFFFKKFKDYSNMNIVLGFF